MKNFLATLSVLIIVGYVSFGQATDQNISNCLSNTGIDSKYLKDFRVQLGKSSGAGDLRYKANISLWKNVKYRFSLCSEENSKGSLILSVKDDASKVVLSSFDPNTGKTYTTIDFTCNKSGIYQLSYDFSNEEQGSGIGIISIIK